MKIIDQLEQQYWDACKQETRAFLRMLIWLYAFVLAVLGVIYTPNPVLWVVIHAFIGPMVITQGYGLYVRWRARRG